MSFLVWLESEKQIYTQTNGRTDTLYAFDDTWLENNLYKVIMKTHGNHFWGWGFISSDFYGLAAEIPVLIWPVEVRGNLKVDYF